MPVLRHGSGPDRVADLHVPDRPGPHRAVVLFHGGGFDAAYGRGMLAPAAEDLRARGVLALNATYRRLGSGGGWPETFDDARAALALLRERDDVADVTVLGFSAGFPLAVHAVTHAAPGDRVRGLIGLAGLTRLTAAARQTGPRGPIQRLFGDPDAVPATYAAIDPIAALPAAASGPPAAPVLAVPALVVHGDADELVPVEEGRAWVRAAGPGAELHEVPGAGHFDVHLPGSAGWAAVLRWLER